MSKTIIAVAQGLSLSVQADGSGLRVLPPELTPTVMAALTQDYEGFYATEDLGVIAENAGTIPRGTYEHTVAAIQALPGGFIVEETEQ